MNKDILVKIGKTALKVGAIALPAVYGLIKDKDEEKEFNNKVAKAVEAKLNEKKES